ncbi:MAG: NADH-quinone oxidoreductase subunit NuoE [Treponema sp.]|nr:NADH-quinone oxidoreductase subunit NuoE [Treponema sp.]
MCSCAKNCLTDCNARTSKYWDLFDDVIKDFSASGQSDTGQLIPLLQRLQDAYGYLPQDVIKKLSEKTGIFTSQIMGVVTFYSQFRLQPVGKNIVRICFGTACHVIGAENIAEAICAELGTKLGGTTEDKMFTVESVACLGCCSLAPVIMINEETHGRLTSDSARSVIRDFKAGKGK